MQKWSDQDFQTVGNWPPKHDRPVIGLFAFDKYNRVLLQFRDDFEGVTGAGQWALFGGAVEAGERLEEALIREIDEELCIKLKPADLEPAAKALSLNHGNAIYTCFYKNAIEPKEISLCEGAGFGFFTKAQLAKLDIAKSIAPIVEFFAANFMSD